MFEITPQVTHDIKTNWQNDQIPDKALLLTRDKRRNKKRTPPPDAEATSVSKERTIATAFQVRALQHIKMQFILYCCIYRSLLCRTHDHSDEIKCKIKSHKNTLMETLQNGFIPVEI